jgi:isopentenyl-diphosphate delta-isomerase
VLELKPEYIVTVDENDNELGIEEKHKCHDGDGILHRAFTLMIKNSKGEYLITKRSDKKRLWPGIWDNSISSHVWKGESYEDAAKRRLPDELGVTADNVKFLFKIRYQTAYKNEGSENEIDAFLIAEGIDEIKPNEDEISEYEFLSYEDLKQDVEKNSEKYSPWSLIIFKKFFEMMG